MNRRAFLSLIGVVGGVVLLPGRARARPALRLRPAAHAAALAYLGELADGASIDGWRIASVAGPERGILSLTMATPAGERFAVDVAQRDPSFPGVAHTAAVELYLSNQGGGGRRSNEAHGLGVMALGRALAAREAVGAVAPALVPLRHARPLD